MQQRDQPRAAFVDEAEFLGDKGPDLARGARQSGGDPGLQRLGLLGAHLARTAAHVEAGQAFDAALFEKIVPAADHVVVEQKNIRHFLAAQTSIQKHQSVRPTRDTARRQAVASQRDQRLAILFAEKAATNHATMRIRPAAKYKTFCRLHSESEYRTAAQAISGRASKPLIRRSRESDCSIPPKEQAQDCRPS